jgi:hypothetical protein
MTDAEGLDTRVQTHAIVAIRTERSPQKTGPVD